MARKKVKSKYIPCPDCPFRMYMPQEFDCCDACLELRYGLTERYDNCDQLGLGDSYYEKVSVLAALRRAEKRANVAALDGEGGGDAE